MTCVVGLVEKDTVHMGVDAAAVQGWTRRTSKSTKVFKRGPFLIGFTTSFRMGQLLEHHLTVPPKKDDEDDVAYLVTTFVERVRTLLKDKGFTKIEQNNEKGGQFLVGYRGRLYTVESDFQLNETHEPYQAVGSGADFALGAMMALDALPPAKRLKRALQVAAHFNMGVAPPFTFMSMSAAESKKANAALAPPPAQPAKASPAPPKAPVAAPPG